MSRSCSYDILEWTSNQDYHYYIY